MNTFTIGQLAKSANVNIETVRYYERRGLIPEPPRLHKSDRGRWHGPGYRQYTDDYVKRIRFIKRAQELGFSLKEIQELLTLRGSAETSCDIKSFVQHKIADVDKKICSLQDIKDALGKLAAECDGNVPVRECPILEAMDSKQPRPEDVALQERSLKGSR